MAKHHLIILDVLCCIFQNVHKHALYFVKSAAMVNWTLISQIYARYVGVPQFCLGMLGNFLNIWIFASDPSYRTTPCSFYLLMASATGSVQLMSGQLQRFLVLGFSIDLTLRSLFWCKLRELLINSFGSIGITFECLATIDQFFVTSRSARLRQLSNIKWAYRIAAGVIIVWIALDIPFFIYTGIQ